MPTCPECDELMQDFVHDMNYVDDERISDSIFTTVDNFIDDLCIRAMDDERSIFSSDRSDGDTPFNYIVDKVIENIDDDLNQVAQDMLDYKITDFDGLKNDSDPNYCEGIDFGDMTPEDFQLYLKNPNIDKDEENDLEDAEDVFTNGYDSIFNA